MKSVRMKSDGGVNGSDFEFIINLILCLNKTKRLKYYFKCIF